jgi:superfamily II DNA or RNA helicase
MVQSYLRDCYEAYVRADNGIRSTPAEQYMEFDETEICGPLSPIRKLSEEGRAEFTAALLSSAESFPPWTLRHETQEKYPAMEFEHPVLKVIRDEGRLRSSLGIRRPEHCFGEGFERWSGLFPVVSLGREHEAELGIPGDLAGVAALGVRAGTVWRALCSHLEAALDDTQIGAFLASACDAGLPRPEGGIRCRVGDAHDTMPAPDVAACDSPRTFKALNDLGRAAVLAPDRSSVETLVKRWGLRTTDEDVRTTPVWVSSSASVPLADYFPLLREDLRQLELLDFEVVPCSELGFEISTAAGTKTEDSSFVVLEDERKLLWSSDGGPQGLLSEIDRRFQLGLSAEDFDAVIAQRTKQDLQSRLASLRNLPEKVDRLLAALGPSVIRSYLPIGLLEAVEAIHGSADDRRLGELLLAVHGYDTLRAVREDLDAAGFEPPARWAGSWEARQFVRRFGFEDEYAGFRGTSRERQLFVPGPSALPDEHDYQREIIDRIGRLITGDAQHKRGMLSLPTGAGKTRVAVQALVEAIADGDLSSPVLWIAQSDELCEQAVQSWSEVWRKYGTDAELTLSRLWGTNEVEESINGPQVVVATVDKLRNRVDDDAYDWLQATSCVVVDEAHTATTPEYTHVLEWAGILMRGATIKTRCPLIGLTATPFRGRSKEQTQRLVDRFGGERLDQEHDDPYGELQRLGVLAAIDGETLEGMSVELSDDEVSRYEQMRDMPKNVLRRIASDVERNKRLLQSIRSKDADWPILLFAISTEHAHTLAALLRLEGIPAVSIDHETDSDLRRRYIDEFRRGDIRVLCNYSVLTQGFDAPAVRAIYVTRPTFSPNVYQQMIGRGLRGPLNGGKERCLIVNIADNWQRFGDDLAFRDFEYLWNRT